VNFLLRNSLTGLVIALAIVFQPEIRRALETLGRTGFRSAPNREEHLRAVDVVVRAAGRLARQQRGALIVIERDTGLRDTLSPHLQMAAMAHQGQEAVLAKGADRDWIYAPDVAQAFVKMLEAPKLPPVAMNVTQGKLWPLAIMAEALADRFQGFKWRFGETSMGYGGPIDRPRRALSGQRIQELLGWSPAFSPETACSDFARRL